MKQNINDIKHKAQICKSDSFVLQGDVGSPSPRDCRQTPEVTVEQLNNNFYNFMFFAYMCRPKEGVAKNSVPAEGSVIS